MAPVARQANMPVIAFSSDEKVAGGGVYLLSFLAGRDVPRIVSFALSRGKHNFAELVPQSPYGRIAEAAFGRAVSAGRRTDRGQRARSRRTIRTPCSGPSARSPTRSKAASRSMRCSCPPAARSFPLSRRCSPRPMSTGARVQLLGTGQWDYPNIGNEKALIGGWYPGARPQGLEQLHPALRQDLWCGAATPREPRLRRGQPRRVAVAGFAGRALFDGAAHAAKRLCRRRRSVPAASRRHLRARACHPRSARRRAAGDRSRAELLRHCLVLSKRRARGSAGSARVGPSVVAARREPFRVIRPSLSSASSRSSSRTQAADGGEPGKVDAFGEAQAPSADIPRRRLRRSAPRRCTSPWPCASTCDEPAFRRFDRRERALCAVARDAAMRARRRCRHSRARANRADCGATQIPAARGWRSRRPAVPRPRTAPG